MDIVNGYNSGNVEQIEKRLGAQQNRYPGEGGFLTPFINAPKCVRLFQAGFKVNFEVQDLETAVYGSTAISTFIMSGTSHSAQRSASPRWPMAQLDVLEQTGRRMETCSLTPIRADQFGYY